MLDNPKLQIKNSGWFPAGDEVQKALAVLSDGAFRAYMYLAMMADRRRGSVTATYSELATGLKRSRRSISTYMGELTDRGICRVDAAPNQHGRNRIEICDEFWPYTKEAARIASSDWDSYCAGIRSLLSKRACIQCEFAATDERFAAELFAQKVSLEELEKAIALACCRKYAGLINGTDNEVIRRLSYFRDSIIEVRDPNAHPIQAQQLNQRVQTAVYLEQKWLAKQKLSADANFASAPRQENNETR